MSKFRVGERAIFVREGSENNKLEVTIIDRLQLCHDPKGNTWYGYPTDYICSNGLRLCPRPHNLRKKSNDGDGLRASDSTKLGSWDKVGWSPVKQPEREVSHG
jgi:hypothetical protein